MHHKNRLSFLLICFILLFSCKTTEEAPEQTQSDSTEETTADVPQGSEGQQQADISPDTVSDDSSEFIEEPEQEPEWEENLEDEETTHKSIPPRGGMKSRPVPPEELVPDEQPEKIEYTESEPETVETSEDIPDIVFPLEPVITETVVIEKELPAAPETDITDGLMEYNKTENKVINDELPSEMDEILSNPLLPLVIKADKDEERPNSRIEEPVIVVEEVTVENTEPVPLIAADESPEPVREEAVPAPASVAENTPISESDYNLSTDSSGKLIINLQGTGWVFLSSSGSSELKLRDKSYDPASGRTRFAFTVKNSGEYNADLVFMKQDLLKGESEQKVLSIDKSNSPERTGAAERNSNVEEETPPTVTDLKPEQIETDGDAAINTAPGDQEAVSSVESEVIALPVEESVAEVKELPVDLNQLAAAELYQLALSYEKPGTGQSLETAMELYLMIKREFPVTEERFKAESRIRYLNKHYFKVQ
ncbi:MULTISPECIES: hypothetical protein [unclassified Oceanispirochaeta]|uniref:hypothetical protein n=1 Tax=unclassified Oceanispirochaeta TaxID=2635722 RepID=UPI000E092DDA|nr:MULTISPECIES: hypothetical protein [unclassified Oceanispirochaeta]MBF9017637.1 hypothetical protein [Oceanispirochaeta sp. M2]NPD74209.1 hypothetical protein [Oceanispirochaeta sp. M1]RDG29915.1 hypothetical protein DV872_19095 [Oceanispirochaeta sp. M1]